MTRDEILRILHAGLRQDGARILLAAEIGSRAFGTATEDSDHDVLAFVAYPLSHYLSLKPGATPAPQIDHDGISVVHLDIRRALAAIADGNLRTSLPLFAPESAIHVDAGLIPRMRAIANHALVPTRMARQFLSSAESALKVAANGGNNRAWLKVLHPTLCGLECLKSGSMPPLDLLELSSRFPDGKVHDLSRRILHGKGTPWDRIDGADSDAVMVLLGRLRRSEELMNPIFETRSEKAAAEALFREIVAGEAGKTTDEPSSPESEAAYRERYAKGLLVGEMGEALAVLGNGDRFGLDTPSGYDAANPHERSRLVEELGDVLAAIEWGARAGIYDGLAVEQRKVRKLAKLMDPNERDNLGRRLAPDLPGKA